MFGLAKALKPVNKNMVCLLHYLHMNLCFFLARGWITLTRQRVFVCHKRELENKHRADIFRDKGVQVQRPWRISTPLLWRQFFQGVWFCFVTSPLLLLLLSWPLKAFYSSQHDYPGTPAHLSPAAANWVSAPTKGMEDCVISTWLHQTSCKPNWAGWQCAELVISNH